MDLAQSAERDERAPSTTAVAPMLEESFHDALSEPRSRPGFFKRLFAKRFVDASQGNPAAAPAAAPAVENDPAAAVIDRLTELMTPASDKSAAVRLHAAQGFEEVAAAMCKIDPLFLASAGVLRTLCSLLLAPEREVADAVEGAFAHVGVRDVDVKPLLDVLASKNGGGGATYKAGEALRCLAAISSRPDNAQLLLRCGAEGPLLSYLSRRGAPAAPAAPAALPCGAAPCGAGRGASRALRRLRPARARYPARGAVAQHGTPPPRASPRAARLATQLIGVVVPLPHACCALDVARRRSADTPRLPAATRRRQGE